MSCSKIWIAPHLRVLVADADQTYRTSLRARLTKLGFRTVDESGTAGETLNRMQDTAYDIVMVEIARPFQSVWTEVEDAGPGETLVVGMSLDRSGHDWVEAILMKAFYTHLLQPVLAHMLASRAAHRCRLVQFPRPEPMETLDIRPSRRFEGTDARDW